MLPFFFFFCLFVIFVVADGFVLVNDVEDEFETSEEFLQEENQLEGVPVYKQLSQKFYELLTSIFKFS